jgi:hypothetical protein
MAKRQVFYSFHYENDVFRVHQIRNIGAIEENKPVSENNWEEVKRKGDASIEKWIDDNMNYRSCVIVLIGEQTTNRKWVKHEIEKAWNEGKGLFGIYIHNLKDPKTGVCKQGANPFDKFTFKDGTKLSSKVKCYNPNSNSPNKEIILNLEDWIEKAINDRKQ